MTYWILSGCMLQYLTQLGFLLSSTARFCGLPMFVWRRLRIVNGEGEVLGTHLPATRIRDAQLERGTARQWVERLPLGHIEDGER